MIITNTTFVASAGADADALCLWLKDAYVGTVRDSHLFDDVVLTHILTQHEPGVESYAVQLMSESRELADRWLDTAAPLLYDRLKQLLPGEGRVLWFTTQMEVVK